MLLKKIMLIVLLCSAVTALLIGCGSTGPHNAGQSSIAVHLSYQTFAQSTLSIHKGDSITLIDDVAVPHTLANGSWVNNTPQPLKENNAPSGNMQFTGNDQQVLGPFPTAGTFHYYCTIHPGMNLTVIVQ